MTTLYETDFVEWAEQQAQLLRSKEFAQVDWINVIEEIESLSTVQKSALRNQLSIVLMYLLKWEFQPSHRSDNWRMTINNQRVDIDILLDESPSLRPRLYQFVSEAYCIAIRKLPVETKLPIATFPKECPYSLEQIMDEDYPFSAD